jgi:hypothetical protein
LFAILKSIVIAAVHNSTIRTPHCEVKFGSAAALLMAARRRHWHDGVKTSGARCGPGRNARPV